MAFTVKLSNFMGVTHFTQVEPTTTICELKKFLQELYASENVSIFKNTREITFGTIESNNIVPNDTLNIICKMKTGSDYVMERQLKTLIEQYNSEQKKINNMFEEYDNYIKLIKEQQTPSQPETPLEILGSIKRELEITEDEYNHDYDAEYNTDYDANYNANYDKEDMRTLFQRCRDQIEDEANKIKQKKQEDEKIKRKLEELRNKMNMKKKKQLSIMNKDSLKSQKKSTFGGFKKGFLLK
jgi:hypothetical protein